MARSQNGWSVRDRGALIWFSVAGGTFAAANRDVAVIGEYLIRRFDAEVERIHGPVLDDWSYAVRNVRGSTSFISNHASATAWDLNATQHPRGVHGTFSSKQLAAIKRILNDITDDSGDRVIVFGGDFSTTTDPMHFEVAAGERSIRQAADKIRRLAKAAEDDVTPQDIAKIIDGVADEVMKRLDSQGIIPNQKVHVDDKPAKDMTFTGCLSNIELNQDQQIAKDGERYVALSGKLDQLIGALKQQK